MQRLWNLSNNTISTNSTINTNNTNSINSIVFSDNNCITGSTDGFVRVWPVDFNKVVMEIDLLDPIMCVGVANDIVLCVTTVSNNNNNNHYN